jgi:predicted nucleic acid-binding protein
MNGRRTSYLDSSGLVKLVLPEAESAALEEYLGPRPSSISCGLVQVEVVRAVRRQGADAVAEARRLLARIERIDVDEPLLRAAADLDQPSLRSLDAIHVAAALSLGEDLAELITYDRRMGEAASTLGLTVVAPA